MTKQVWPSDCEYEHKRIYIETGNTGSTRAGQRNTQQVKKTCGFALRVIQNKSDEERNIKFKSDL